MPKQRLAAFICTLIISSCVSFACCGAEAAVCEGASFSEEVARKSGVLELLNTICSRSWTIFLATFGAERDVVAAWEDGFHPKKPCPEVTGDMISAIKAESELIGPTIAAAELVSAGKGTAGDSTNSKASTAASACPSIVTHVVEQGESLWTIANCYGVSVDTITWANSLANPNRVKVGQVLKFPSVTGVLHEVRRGDTIWTIAKNYGVSRDKIVQANAIDNPDSLKLKQSLIIPGAKPPVASSRVTVASRGGGASNTRISSAIASTGGLSWPVSGRITSRFGPRWGRMHNGIDIGVPTGTAVRAAAAGCVIFAGWNGGYGRLVILDHGNGVHTYYGHNSGFTVSRGDQVAAGERIARSGNSGISTGPHVHFEVRVNGKPQNPANYLP